MTRELCSEGWTVDKVRIMNQIKPKYRKWTPGVTRTIDKDKCNRSVIDPYDYEPLQLLSRRWSSLARSMKQSGKKKSEMYEGMIWNNVD